MTVNNPGLGATIKGTPVTIQIALNMPTSWTDLNLQGAVGTKLSVVCLRYINKGSNPCDINVRPNGSSIAGVISDNSTQKCDTTNGASYSSHVICITSSTGYIEHISSAAENHDIYVEWYINL